MLRVRRSVGVGVMHQFMHVLSKQVFSTLMAEKTHTCGVTKCAISIQIESINRFGGGIEQQKVLFLALLKRLRTIFQISNVNADPKHVLGAIAHHNAVCADPTDRLIRTHETILRSVFV